MSLQINGVDDLMKALKKGVDLTDVGNVVKQSGSELQRDAMRNVPVDTGTLRRSIALTMHKGNMEARVKANMDYAAYVEFGTRYQKSQPYMRPAFHKVNKRFINDLDELMK